MVDLRSVERFLDSSQETADYLADRFLDFYVENERGLKMGVTALGVTAMGYAYLEGVKGESSELDQLLGHFGGGHTGVRLGEAVDERIDIDSRKNEVAVTGGIMALTGIEIGQYLGMVPGSPEAGGAFQTGVGVASTMSSDQLLDYLKARYETR